MINHYSPKNDQAIMEAIRQGGAARERVLECLYKDRQWINRAGAVYQRKGRPAIPFDDLYQEAFYIFDKKIRTNSFEGKSSLLTYFSGILEQTLYSLIRSEQRKNNRDQEYAAMIRSANQPLTPLDYLFAKDRKRLLDTYLGQLGPTCKQALLLWAKTWKYEEIAVEMKYAYPQSAGNTISACMKKLRELFGPILAHLLE